MNGKIIACVVIALIGLASCSSHDTKPGLSSTGDDAVSTDTSALRGWTARSDSDSLLVIYTPNYQRIDLACDSMPSQKDSSVIFCAEAAFTSALAKDFKHSYICGDHVSSGKRYKGSPCRRNSGAFVYYNDKYKFLYNYNAKPKIRYKSYSNELDSAAKYGGMGFGQEMLIHQGKFVPCMRKDGNVNKFRALCELDNQLCIIDSKHFVEFGKFKKAMLRAGVTEALYLDMGGGWNHSWWRGQDGSAHVIHPHVHDYTTNWITFYN